MSGVLVGSSDVPLDGSEIAPLSIAVDSVYCSPLVRARQTAARLFPMLEAQVVDGFAERDLGAWELKSWAEIEGEVGGRDWLEVVPPGGEGWSEFVARVRGAWEGLAKSGEFAVVAHVGVNSVLHELLTGAAAVGFEQKYLEVKSIVIPD